MEQQIRDRFVQGDADQLLKAIAKKGLLERELLEIGVSWSASFAQDMDIKCSFLRKEYKMKMDAYEVVFTGVESGHMLWAVIKL